MPGIRVDSREYAEFFSGKLGQHSTENVGAG